MLYAYKHCKFANNYFLIHKDVQNKIRDSNDKSISVHTVIHRKYIGHTHTHTHTRQAIQSEHKRSINRRSFCVSALFHTICDCCRNERYLKRDRKNCRSAKLKRAIESQREPPITASLLFIIIRSVSKKDSKCMCVAKQYRTRETHNLTRLWSLVAFERSSLNVVYFSTFNKISHGIVTSTRCVYIHKIINLVSSGSFLLSSVAHFLFVSIQMEIRLLLFFFSLLFIKTMKIEGLHNVCNQIFVINLFSIRQWILQTQSFLLNFILCHEQFVSSSFNFVFERVEQWMKT